MPFQPLEEFFDASITLPVNGKSYTIESPDAETGLFCQRLMQGAATVLAGQEVSETELEKLRLDDAQEQDLYQRLLGSTWDELFADNVPWTLIKHVGTTTLVWVTQSRDDAEAFWEAGPKKVEVAAPQDHKPKAVASSSAGSSPRKKTPRKRAATAGRNSSTTGH